LLSGHNEDLTMRSSTMASESLVFRYVADILEVGDQSAIKEVLAPNFVDHDPIAIPGVLADSYETSLDRQIAIALLVQSRSLSITIHLEKVICEQDFLAYRIYGGGEVVLWQADDSRVVGSNSPGSTTMWNVPLGRENLRVVPRLMPDSKVVDGKLLFSIACVGMFRVHNGLLVERWGSVRLL